MERIEERLTYLEDHVKNLEEYLQWFQQELFVPDCMDVHFDAHHRDARQIGVNSQNIADLKAQISSLESLVLRLRQAIIKLHSDEPVHTLIK